MKLTKYKHACFALEKDGSSIVVDPGNWSTDFVCPSNVLAIVITHEHPDHCASATLRDCITKNPAATIYTHTDVATQLHDLPVQAVAPGDTIDVNGVFRLEFFGGQHAIIHTDIQPVANIGILINDSIYYSGDSFTLPERHIEWLALPVAAPWLKLAEAIDFARTVNASHVFPTHDAVLSTEGKHVVDALSVRLIGASYQRLVESIEI